MNPDAQILLITNFSVFIINRFFSKYRKYFLCTLDCSWVNMWFLLELNTVSFIIILIKRNNYIFDQRIIKYFLFQAITLIFLFLRFSNKYFADYLVRLFIFMKLGIFPFPLWFINILKDLDPRFFFSTLINFGNRWSLSNLSTPKYYSD